MQPGNAMQVFWMHDWRALFSEARSERGSAKYILIVEPLPSKKQWDWAVWRKHQADVRHGVAPSTMAAIEEAEAACRSWDSESSSIAPPHITRTATSPVED